MFISVYEKFDMFICVFKKFDRFISVYKKFHMFINVEKVMKYVRNSYVSLFTLTLLSWQGLRNTCIIYKKTLSHTHTHTHTQFEWDYRGMK